MSKIMITIGIALCVLSGCARNFYSDRTTFLRTEEPKTQAKTTEEIAAAVAEVPGLQVTEVQYTGDRQGFIVKLRYLSQPDDDEPFQAADQRVIQFENALAPFGYISMRQAMIDEPANKEIDE